MDQGKMVQPGEMAKDFAIKDQNDKIYSLYEDNAPFIILSFHPLAWTEFCAAQMISLEDNYDTLTSLGCNPVGVSVDSRPCKKA